jgi:IS5 family transposase
MLRIHCLQQGFDLSDPGAEDALYEIESMRRFAGIELGETPVPDETTILNFRRLLEQLLPLPADVANRKGLPRGITSILRR